MVVPLDLEFAVIKFKNVLLQTMWRILWQVMQACGEFSLLAVK